MTAETHSQLANFIWSICNLLRGRYKRNEYRKVIITHNSEITMCCREPPDFHRRVPDRETAKIDRLVVKVEAAIEKLQEYRTALSTAAVKGKIDIKQAA